MHKGFRSSMLLKPIVTAAVSLAITPLTLGVTITINNDVATGTILDGSSIPIDGWVYGAHSIDPEEPTVITATHANKVKIYLFYQQTRPGPSSSGTTRYQLDADFASLNMDTEEDNGYEGSLTANMPDQQATPVSPSCWFLRSEAILDTPGNPNALVAWVEKDVDLEWGE